MGAPADTEAESADRVASGRAVLARGEWENARRIFETAVTQAGTPEALEGLSWAAWWLNDAPVVFESRSSRPQRGGST